MHEDGESLGSDKARSELSIPEGEESRVGDGSVLKREREGGKYSGQGVNEESSAEREMKMNEKLKKSGDTSGTGVGVWKNEWAVGSETRKLAGGVEWSGVTLAGREAKCIRRRSPKQDQPIRYD